MQEWQGQPTAVNELVPAYTSRMVCLRHAQSHEGPKMGLQPWLAKQQAEVLPGLPRAVYQPQRPCPVQFDLL
jgi:hypothetical protein